MQNFFNVPKANIIHDKIVIFVVHEAIMAYLIYLFGLKSGGRLVAGQLKHFGIAVQCSAVQCSAVQCSAVQCSAVQCSAVQCSAVQWLLQQWMTSFSLAQHITPVCLN